MSPMITSSSPSPPPQSLSPPPPIIIYKKNDIVDITRRMTPNINKPGGSARITNIHYSSSSPPVQTSIDVKYLVEGGGEKKVLIFHIKGFLDPFASTHRETLGRCECTSMRVDCGSCDLVEIMRKASEDEKRREERAKHREVNDLDDEPLRKQLEAKGLRYKGKDKKNSRVGATKSSSSSSSSSSSKSKKKRASSDTLQSWKSSGTTSTSTSTSTSETATTKTNTSNRSDSDSSNSDSELSENAKIVSMVRAKQGQSSLSPLPSDSDSGSGSDSNSGSDSDGLNRPWYDTHPKKKKDVIHKNAAAAAGRSEDEKDSDDTNNSDGDGSSGDNRSNKRAEKSMEVHTQQGDDDDSSSESDNNMNGNDNDDDNDDDHDDVNRNDNDDDGSDEDNVVDNDDDSDDDGDDSSQQSQQSQDSQDSQDPTQDNNGNFIQKEGIIIDLPPDVKSRMYAKLQSTKFCDLLPFITALIEDTKVTHFNECRGEWKIFIGNINNDDDGSGGVNDKCINYAEEMLKRHTKVLIHEGKDVINQGLTRLKKSGKTDYKDYKAKLKARGGKRWERWKSKTDELYDSCDFPNIEEHLQVVKQKIGEFCGGGGSGDDDDDFQFDDDRDDDGASSTHRNDRNGTKRNRRGEADDSHPHATLKRNANKGAGKNNRQNRSNQTSTTEEMDSDVSDLDDGDDDDFTSSHSYSYSGNDATKLKRIRRERKTEDSDSESENRDPVKRRRKVVRQKGDGSDGNSHSRSSGNGRNGGDSGGGRRRNLEDVDVDGSDYDNNRGGGGGVGIARARNENGANRSNSHSRTNGGARANAKSRDGDVDGVGDGDGYRSDGNNGNDYDSGEFEDEYGAFFGDGASTSDYADSSNSNSNARRHQRKRKHVDHQHREGGGEGKGSTATSTTTSTSDKRKEQNKINSMDTTANPATKDHWREPTRRSSSSKTQSKSKSESYFNSGESRVGDDDDSDGYGNGSRTDDGDNISISDYTNTDPHPFTTKLYRDISNNKLPLQNQIEIVPPPLPLPLPAEYEDIKEDDVTGIISNLKNSLASNETDAALRMLRGITVYAQHCTTPSANSNSNSIVASQLFTCLNDILQNDINFPISIYVDRKKCTLVISILNAIATFISQNLYSQHGTGSPPEFKVKTFMIKAVMAIVDLYYTEFMHNAYPPPPSTIHQSNKNKSKNKNKSFFFTFNDSDSNTKQTTVLHLLKTLSKIVFLPEIVAHIISKFYPLQRRFAMNKGNMVSSIDHYLFRLDYKLGSVSSQSRLSLMMNTTPSTSTSTTSTTTACVIPRVEISAIYALIAVAASVQSAAGVGFGRRHGSAFILPCSKHTNEYREWNLLTVLLFGKGGVFGKGRMEELNGLDLRRRQQQQQHNKNERKHVNIKKQIDQITRELIYLTTLLTSESLRFPVEDSGIIRLSSCSLKVLNASDFYVDDDEIYNDGVNGIGLNGSGDLKDQRCKEAVRIFRIADEVGTERESKAANKTSNDHERDYDDSHKPRSTLTNLFPIHQSTAALHQLQVAWFKNVAGKGARKNRCKKEVLRYLKEFERNGKAKETIRPNPLSSSSSSSSSSSKSRSRSNIKELEHYAYTILSAQIGGVFDFDDAFDSLICLFGIQVREGDQGQGLGVAGGVDNDVYKCAVSSMLAKDLKCIVLAVKCFTRIIKTNTSTSPVITSSSVGIEFKCVCKCMAILNSLLNTAIVNVTESNEYENCRGLGFGALILNKGKGKDVLKVIDCVDTLACVCVLIGKCLLSLQHEAKGLDSTSSASSTTDENQIKTATYTFKLFSKTYINAIKSIANCTDVHLKGAGDVAVKCALGGVRICIRFLGGFVNDTDSDTGDFDTDTENENGCDDINGHSHGHATADRMNEDEEDDEEAAFAEMDRQIAADYKRKQTHFLHLQRQRYTKLLQNATPELQTLLKALCEVIISTKPSSRLSVTAPSLDVSSVHRGGKYTNCGHSLLVNNIGALLCCLVSVIGVVDFDCSNVNSSSTSASASASAAITWQNSITRILHNDYTHFNDDVQYTTQLKRSLYSSLTKLAIVNSRCRQIVMADWKGLLNVLVECLCDVNTLYLFPSSNRKSSSKRATEKAELEHLLDPTNKDCDGVSVVKCSKEVGWCEAFDVSRGYKEKRNADGVFTFGFGLGLIMSKWKRSSNDNADAGTGGDDDIDDEDEDEDVAVIGKILTTTCIAANLAYTARGTLENECAKRLIVLKSLFTTNMNTRTTLPLLLPVQTLKLITEEIHHSLLTIQHNSIICENTPSERKIYVEKKPVLFELYVAIFSSLLRYCTIHCYCVSDGIGGGVGHIQNDLNSNDYNELMDMIVDLRDIFIVHALKVSVTVPALSTIPKPHTYDHYIPRKSTTSTSTKQYIELTKSIQNYITLDPAYTAALRRRLLELVVYCSYGDETGMTGNGVRKVVTGVLGMGVRLGEVLKGVGNDGNVGDEDKYIGSDHDDGDGDELIDLLKSVTTHAHVHVHVHVQFESEYNQRTSYQILIDQICNGEGLSESEKAKVKVFRGKVLKEVTDKYNFVLNKTKT